MCATRVIAWPVMLYPASYSGIVLFRCVTLVTPDVDTILRVKLCADAPRQLIFSEMLIKAAGRSYCITVTVVHAAAAGCAAYSELGRKAAALYRMCAQQLQTNSSSSCSSSDSSSSSNKRCCYDFSLRAAVAALQHAGALKRAATATGATASATAHSTDTTARSTSVVVSNEGSTTSATAGSTVAATSVSEESVIAELIRCAVVPSLVEQHHHTLLHISLESPPELDQHQCSDTHCTLAVTHMIQGLLLEVPVFLALLRDTFTAAVINSTSSSSSSSSSGNSSSSSSSSGSSLSEHLAQAAAALHYSAATSPAWLAKALQLHDVLAARHAVAVVGTAGCGKTGMLTCLQGALSSANGAPHRRVTINPKALAIEDFYGRADSTTGEWSNGIFAALWCRANANDTHNTSSSSSTASTAASAPTATETLTAATAVWIVCDGPVDSSWTDVLHSALSDSSDSSSRMLVLASGDRVPMSDTVKLYALTALAAPTTYDCHAALTQRHCMLFLTTAIMIYAQVVFETDTLAQASSATVSRLGVVHVSVNCLGWEPLVMAWLAARSDQQRTCFTVLWSHYVGNVTSTGGATANVDLSKQLLFETLSLQLKGTDSVSLKPKVKTVACRKLLADGEHALQRLGFSRVAAVQATLQLLTALLSTAQLTQVQSDAPAVSNGPSTVKLQQELHRLFVHSLAWGVGGGFGDVGRIQLDAYIRATAATAAAALHSSSSSSSNLVLPPLERTSNSSGTTATTTVFDYIADTDTVKWERWAVTMSPYGFTGNGYTNGYSTGSWAALRVPTCDSTRALHIVNTLQALQSQQRPAVLLSGAAGNGKTATVDLLFAHAAAPLLSAARNSGSTGADTNDTATAATTAAT
eukprot:1013-Heterococcus_DN1.PRE.1